MRLLLKPKNIFVYRSLETRRRDGGYRRAFVRSGMLQKIYCLNYSGFRIQIRTDPHVFALPGSGQKGKEMNE